MGGVVKAIFGGGDNGAAEAAERARQERQIANDRQLAASNRADAKSGGSRRAPRGRRLFEDEALGELPKSLGDA
uniref:hypothetical protein n=1 Tax=Stappia sp. TaxID=1870903 RepID=UPI003BAC6459